ncbi:pro-FMRFamide-related neuropeptide VF [Clinocottus analis]|uniref:pro-FMRFamide-related neuropeptide VF n=1 Tax=Clinocottus analis TaxID=304258 RepID=UPI0035C1FC2B
MLTTVFLSTLLMLGGLGGAAASDSHVYGKSINLSSNDGEHTMKRQPHQQTKSEIHRSLDFESFNILVTPRTNKISLPHIIKLYPPTTQPLHLRANMPLRFGRESVPVDDSEPNSTPNMPQRFGRFSEEIRRDADGPKVREAPKTLPQRFGRSNPYRSLLRTLLNAKLLNTGLHWAEYYDSTTSSGEVEIQEKSFRG